MGLNNTARNAAVAAITSACGYISLHDGDPGTTGANEITGGSPAYARQAVTWGSASGGTQSITGTETFNIPAGSDVTHWGLQTASSGGTFYGGEALSASESFPSQGIYELTTASVTVT